MKILKSHFEIHERFRNGILLLSVMLLVLLAFFYFYSNKKSNVIGLEELNEFQNQVDSLKMQAAVNAKSYQLRPFNPNFITEYKGYVLGMSPEQLDMLYKYRSSGRWINSIADFKEVTQVSDSLLSKISPLFKFPDWVTTNKKGTVDKKQKFLKKSFAQKKDLNKVTSLILQGEVGVPDFIAERIIKYRESLNGFVDDLQLKDVSGLYESQRKKMLLLYTVKTKKEVNKINVNTATVKELMKVPYFDFETAIEIRDFVVQRNGVSTLEELKDVEGFSFEKIDRIALYLKLN